MVRSRRTIDSDDTMQATDSRPEASERASDTEGQCEGTRRMGWGLGESWEEEK